MKFSWLASKRRNNHDWTDKQWMITLFWPETYVYVKDFSGTVQPNKRMFTAGSVILSPSPSVSPNFLPSSHPPPHFSLDRYIDRLLKPLQGHICVCNKYLLHRDLILFKGLKKWSYTRIIIAKIWINKNDKQYSTKPIFIPMTIISFQFLLLQSNSKHVNPWCCSFPNTFRFLHLNYKNKSIIHLPLQQNWG